MILYQVYFRRVVCERSGLTCDRGGKSDHSTPIGVQKTECMGERPTDAVLGSETTVTQQGKAVLETKDTGDSWSNLFQEF